MQPNEVDSIIEGVTKRVDARLGEAFARFESRLEEHANAQLAANEEHRQAIDRLNREVFGSKPPPPSARTPVVARITQGEGNLADVTGRLMAVQGQLSESQKASEDYRQRTEKRLDDQDQKLATVDLKQDEQLETLKSIKGAVTGVLTHPLAKKLGAVVALCLIAWFGTVTARIEQRSAKLEATKDAEALQIQHLQARIDRDGGVR